MSRRYIAALIAGALFGLGLVISDMISPTRVVGFLSVGQDWDPTLLFVMGGGLLVAAPAFRLILKRQVPLWSPQFHLPTRKEIDVPLIAGSVLFGMGWGLGGLCPGPALASLSGGSMEIVGAVMAMFVGHKITSLVTVAVVRSRAQSLRGSN